MENTVILLGTINLRQVDLIKAITIPPDNRKIRLAKVTGSKMGSETGIYGTDDLRNVGRAWPAAVWFLVHGLGKSDSERGTSRQRWAGCPRGQQNLWGPLVHRSLWQVKVWDQSCGEELVSSFPFPDLSLVLQWILNKLSSPKMPLSSCLCPPCSILDLALQKLMSDAEISLPQVSIQCFVGENRT